MKSKLLLLIFFLLASPLAIMAQNTTEGSEKVLEQKDDPQLQHDIGVVLNDLNQVGLSYRHWFGKNKLKNFGFQTSLAYRSQNSGSNSNFYGGLSFLYMLSRSEHVNLFLYQKNSLTYNEASGTRNSGETFLHTSRSFGNSLGFGIEVIALQRLSINLSGGYGVTTNNSNNNPTNQSSLGLEAEFGLFYKF